MSKKSLTKRWWFWLVALVVLAGIGKAVTKEESGGNEASTSGAAKEHPEPAPQPKPAMKVTALKLFEEYQANEVSADQAYKGKLLEVTGKVDSITKDAFDNVIVRLQTSNEFMAVATYPVDEEVNAAAGLAKGQAVTMQCEGEGMVMGSPVLRECSFK